jgi:S-DNA-T family DNA segregation ATPase FtsK/SpoIIIE
MENISSNKVTGALLGIGDEYRPRRRFTPAQRDPWHLPEDEIELPPPSPMPPAPASLNLITSVLPPVILVGGTLIFSLITGSINWMLMGPMLIMSMGFPIANIIGLSTQKRAYKKNMIVREQSYRQKLESARAQIAQTAEIQVHTLQQIYPPLAEVVRSIISQDTLLWARRQTDDDFLSIRIGEGTGQLSFSVEMPRYFDQNDNLIALAQQVTTEVTQVNGVPILFELSRIGSLALTSKVSSSVYSVLRRMILDLAAHHSPQNLRIAVLADNNDAIKRWEWLKWLPHVDAFSGASKIQQLAFDNHRIDKFMEWLQAEYQLRRGQVSSFSATIPRGNQPAIVILLDDTGQVRQNPDIALLADLGGTVGIHLIFVGGRDWPRECRARLELADDRQFRLLETWSRDARPKDGIFETASIDECERVARVLSGLEVGGAQASVPLPASIRLSEILGNENLNLEAIKQRWSLDFPIKELLKFPVGVRARRDQLDMATINLLPEKADGHDVGGYDAYHTILIGTTGSGKSEFMKSVVMGAAIKYPPSLLNFFFMDFKGGAAFSVFENLPHVSGIVTNLSPELVERGLDSIRNEIDRRMDEFAQAKVRDIWAFNLRQNEKLMPHLVLLLDEFARGLSDFPRLRDVLDMLVRQGRSLGMYLILANQDVNSEVDKLLNNVGWRIALKVAKPEEMGAMIGRNLSMASRAGQGYLKRGDDVVEFQAGYAGLPVRSSASMQADEFTIFHVDADGSYHKFYTHTNLPREREEKKDLTESQKEEELIVSLLHQATGELHIKPAPKIYLDPLPEEIPLETILTESGIQARFANGAWQDAPFARRLKLPLGLLDMPKECRQEQLVIDFEDRDGHLWIIGAPGSGRERVMSSLFLAMAQTYSPEEAQFYILELGGGDLRMFEGMPHTGAVIRPQFNEKERFERLLDFLEKELERRTSGSAFDDNRSTDPFIFLVINNFAELRSNYPDEAERLARFVRDGKRARIHMVITTNRGPELTMSLRANIARRLVLQLGSKDEHLDLVGRDYSMLNDNIDGRGYWWDGEHAYECQVGYVPDRPRDLIQDLNNAWVGSRPKTIEMLPANLPFNDFVSRFTSVPSGLATDRARVLVGQSYENLEPIMPDLEESSQTWLVLGPKESGKSNFIASTALGVLATAPEGSWNIHTYALRRSPLMMLGQQNSQVNVLSIPAEIVADIQQLIIQIQDGSLSGEKRTLLLIDDLGAAFQPGKDELALAINQLAAQLENAPSLYIIAAGLLDELRMRISDPVVKLLKQSRMGLALSKDNQELDWLGGQISLAQRRMELNPGRGFFINRGRALLVQTPFVSEHGKPLQPD